MKYLALAVLLAVMQAGPTIPRKTADTQTTASQNVSNDAKDNKTPPGAPMTVPQSVASDVDKPKTDSVKVADTQQAVRIVEPSAVSVNRDWIDCAALVLSAALVLIAGIGTWVAVSSLTLLRTQTVATQRAAEAALLNAQALIHIERPWLILGLVPTGPNIDEVEFYATESPAGERQKHTTCTFHLMNYGRTPAIVTAQKWELQIGKTTDKPVDLVFFNIPTPVPPYIFPQGVSQPKVAILAQNITHDMKAAFDMGLNSVYFCGFIRYKDSVPREIAVAEYETTFCYLYRDGTGEARWELGPPEYNRAS